MREQRFTLLLSCAVFLLCFATQAQSQLSRVYVSETDGNDVPPCGPIKKPCKTFAFSLGQVLPKGHIIVLNTGEYGPARITQSVTIEAPPGVNALVQSFLNSPSTGAVGVEIAAGPNDVVTLRGIKISLYPPPAVRGIVFSSGGALYVENCVVEGPNEGIDIFPFGFTGDVRVFIRDTVTSNSGDGIRVLRHTASSVLVQIERSSMEGNYVGLNVGDGAAATARGCVMVRNRIQGVGVGGATGTFPPRPTELTIEDGLISGNDTGIGANNTNVTVRVSHCTITDNQFGLSGFGGPFAVQVLTRGNNTLEANTINGTFTGVYTAK